MGDFSLPVFLELLARNLASRSIQLQLAHLGTPRFRILVMLLANRIPVISDRSSFYSARLVKEFCVKVGVGPAKPNCISDLTTTGGDFLF